MNTCQTFHLVFDVLLLGENVLVSSMVIMIINHLFIIIHKILTILMFTIPIYLENCSLSSPSTLLDGGEGEQVRGKDNTINLFSTKHYLYHHFHDEEDEDDDEKYKDDWYFSIAKRKRKNEIGANVYGYWHC